MNNLQNQTPVPADVLTLSEAFFRGIGLDDLDMPTKLAFVQDLYPQYLAQGTSTNTVLWTPINEMQALASASEADELYCGGKAGTGKTDLLVGEAITNHKKSIIFRSTYSEMEQLEERSRELLAATGASYNASQTSKRWRDIPGGRTIKFGNLKKMSDVDKYRGRDHDFVGFDEIPTFQEKVYLTVLAWARSDDENQRVRVICTGNPPTDSSQLWVKRRWAAWVDDKYPHTRAEPGELRWFVNLDGKDTEVESPDVVIYDSKDVKLEPLSRTFIPGEMLEHYKKGNYEARLQALPEPYRSQLLFGDFNLAEKDKARQVIPTEHVRLAMERWEDMDKPDVPLGSVGVDVARGGDDQTVISKRFDNWFDELIKYDGIQTKTGSEVAAVVEQALEGDKDARIEIDLSGVGSSPYDILDDNEFNVDGFNGASKSTQRDGSGRVGFRNRRAEAWWLFREALDPESGEEIALPPDNELLSDLTEPTFILTANGYQIEEKEKIIERLGRSPDCGDAVVMNYNAVSRGDVVFF